MPSPKGSNGSDHAFPAADAEKKLNPGTNRGVEVDPVSAEVAASVEIKERAKATKKQEEKENKEALQSLKRAIIVSGIVVAVAGAVFAITKKLREK
ncbi:hypothetical protein RJ639_002095 [Escallonia herrerae]|uniref:Transmembrane protein n=1 Tax=Escallonia herrerae TaxID=1293975 RepID=A0AA89BTR4_9ASTE|nr:hypothetical protein RJ639_002095 [Escallonia herrerae]